MTKHEMMLENARLRAALRPFAMAAKSLEDEPGSMHLMHTDIALTLCAADLRKAAEAISN